MFEFLIVFILIFVFALAAYVFFSYGRKKKLGGREQKYIRSHWERVMNVWKVNSKEAIMDADKLLDYALKAKGYQGSLGEKMKKAGGLFSDRNGVWTAHKLRNRVAHEMVELKEGEVKSALRSFKRALKDLGADV